MKKRLKSYVDLYVKIYVINGIRFLLMIKISDFLYDNRNRNPKNYDTKVLLVQQFFQNNILNFIKNNIQIYPQSYVV